MRRIALAALSLALAGLLLWWALQEVPFARIAQTLANLSLVQIALLVLVNAAIMLLFAWRWWLILRRQGGTVPYLRLSAYRLAAFGVSYFTPGPHFGGEPLQVLLLSKRHAIKTRVAATSVALDKLIELIANFGFLVFAAGAVFLFSPDLLGQSSLRLGFSALLILLPLLYLGLIWRGARPLSWLASLRPGWAARVAELETALTDLLRTKPRLLLQTLAASALVWAALVFEYQLALAFLGQPLPLLSILTIMLFARLAMLAPTPGALGALEAGLVLALSLLGIEAAFALSLALLIRARDVLFGGLGLALGAALGLPRSSAA